MQAMLASIDFFDHAREEVRVNAMRSHRALYAAYDQSARRSRERAGCRADNKNGQELRDQTSIVFNLDTN